MEHKRRLHHLFTDVRFQLVYGILLMVLLPLIVVINTIVIINRYNENIDIALQRQALLIGKIFSSATKNTITDPYILQQMLKDAKRSSADILSVHVLVPSGTGFLVTASTIPENINQRVDYYYYDIAFKQKENEGLATDSVRLSRSGRAYGLELLEYAQRFWLVSLPLFDAQNNRVGLLSIQMSSEVVDNLTDSSWRASVFSLTLTVLLAVLFLAASTRLWGYAQLYRKMKEVETMKDEFIAIASHELRTPITTMLGYVSMILEGSFGAVTDSVRQGLDRVQASSRRLGDLVEDLLNVSRIEQKRIILEMQKINPVSIVIEVIAELKLEAEKKGINLACESEKSKVSSIMADRDKCKQALINIIGNAVKYTHKGTVTVTVQNKDHDVEIRVKDTGIGISAEDQKRLFEKFYRVRTDDTKGIVGTGLGLWITKQLIEMMKGKIYIESIAGTGTQVTVIFSKAGNKEA